MWAYQVLIGASTQTVRTPPRALSFASSTTGEAVSLPRGGIGLVRGIEPIPTLRNDNPSPPAVPPAARGVVIGARPHGRGGIVPGSADRFGSRHRPDPHSRQRYRLA